MAQLWIDDLSEQAEPTGGVELVEAVPASDDDRAPPRTRYTDLPVRPLSNFVAHLMAVDGDPWTGERYRAASSQASAAYRSTVGQAYGAARGSRTRRMS